MFFSLARILCLRNGHAGRMIHSAKGHFALAAESSAGAINDESTTFADTEGTVLQDIEVGRYLCSH